MNGQEAAVSAGVTPTSVTRWIKSGQLPAERGARGEWIINPQELARFLEARLETYREGGRRSSGLLADLAAAREKIRGLESLIEQQRGWLADSEARVGLLLSALPPPRRRRWYWPFG